MDEAEALVGNMWTSMSSWFTPTILFCVMNLVIGTIFLTSNFITHHRHHPPPTDGEHHPPQLVRAPSITERIRSINFSLYRSEQPETHHADPPPEKAESQDHHVTRSKSDATGEAHPARAFPAKRTKSENKNSMAEEVVPRRPAAASGEEEGVDAKADDFINRFKQQLKLQRLDSLRRFTEMLNRGSGR